MAGSGETPATDVDHSQHTSNNAPKKTDDGNWDKGKVVNVFGVDVPENLFYLVSTAAGTHAGRMILTPLMKDDKNGRIINRGIVTLVIMAGAFKSLYTDGRYFRDPMFHVGRGTKWLYALYGYLIGDSLDMVQLQAQGNRVTPDMCLHHVIGLLCADFVTRQKTGHGVALLCTLQEIMPTTSLLIALTNATVVRDWAKGWPDRELKLKKVNRMSAWLRILVLGCIRIPAWTYIWYLMTKQISQLKSSRPQLMTPFYGVSAMVGIVNVLDCYWLKLMIQPLLHSSRRISDTE